MSGLEGVRFPHRLSYVDGQGYIMVVESPFPHEADAVGNDAIDDEFGIVAHSQVLAKEGVPFPYLIDERLLAFAEGMGHPGDAELVMLRREVA